ncbi:MAG TPA: hypothetical protein PLY36_13915 [Spirochaetota bacterium]|nr:hypothetical protein [Spirochaetota bacterium]
MEKKHLRSSCSRISLWSNIIDIEFYFKAAEIFLSTPSVIVTQRRLSEIPAGIENEITRTEYKYFILKRFYLKTVDILSKDIRRIYEEYTKSIRRKENIKDKTSGVIFL